MCSPQTDKHLLHFIPGYCGALFTPTGNKRIDGSLPKDLWPLRFLLFTAQNVGGHQGEVWLSGESHSPKLVASRFGLESILWTQGFFPHPGEIAGWLLESTLTAPLVPSCDGLAFHDLSKGSHDGIIKVILGRASGLPAVRRLEQREQQFEMRQG